MDSGKARSANRSRTLRLLVGGMLGAGIAAAGCILGFGAGFGVSGLLTAAGGALVTIAFFALGHLAIVAVADADPKVQLMVSLTSYAARVVVLGYLLWGAIENADAIAFLHPPTLLITVVVVVFAWLGAELWTYTRLRIPAFDPPES